MYEVYFETTMGLETFANWLRDLLNLPTSNKSSYQREQQREGVNLGGTYYLFEVLGMELLLLRNMGETEIPERPTFPLYLVIRSGSAVLDQVIAEWIRELSCRGGIRAEVDSLSA